ncbi:XapX domain-containing protein [Luteibacter sp. OK325]|uniref:DUF1427 family protein n=1 Tax=Luteibacter sp. OK325 TaxID=2135670 RepID=UPI000D373E0D|nr:DUF1427 family protein [Luteibacter sp. OK325]PTR34079.1 XapX domain-containing protein [Luteibacter sp. OK325]
MKLYLFSLLAGLVVGCFYSLVGVRSPAPPIVALVGLLGIVLGEQLTPVVKQLIPALHAEASLEKSLAPADAAADDAKRRP